MQLTQTQVSEFSEQISSFRKIFVDEGPGSVDSDLDQGKNLGYQGELFWGVSQFWPPLRNIVQEYFNKSMTIFWNPETLYISLNS